MFRAHGKRKTGEEDPGRKFVPRFASHPLAFPWAISRFTLVQHASNVILIVWKGAGWCVRVFDAGGDETPTERVRRLR